MKRNGFVVMRKLISLLQSLRGYMCLAILLGFLGHLCASFITIFGGYAVLYVLFPELNGSLGILFVIVILLAALRAVFRYAEQTLNHFIAFNLLAIIRDRVFQTLRKLAPAKLEGRDKR